VTDALGIAPEAVTPWLVASAARAVAPVRYAPIGSGRSNITIRADDATGRSWVLRRQPAGAVLDSAHDVLREHRILRCLAISDVPVPRILGVCCDVAVSDAPLVLMEHVAGSVISTRLTAEALEPETRRALGFELARTLARIHAVDLQRTELSDLSSHRPYVARQVKRWLAQWEATRPGPLALVDQLAERLAAGAPPQDDIALLHGDYHLLNVIVDPRSGSIRCVLDWELSTLGDPLADLGMLLVYWPQPGDDPILSPFAMSTLPGFPTRAELVDDYARASGRDVASIRFWHALSCWKVAIIAAGVISRDRGDGDDLALVRPLLERASRLADEAGI
jgi:aminoglycoside phosphotransferase (APT) family kinase protein